MSLVIVIRLSGSSGPLLWVQVIVGVGLPSVSVHLMVTDIPTRVVTFVAGMMVREGCTGEGGEGRKRRGKEEGKEGRERREEKEGRKGR